MPFSVQGRAGIPRTNQVGHRLIEQRRGLDDAHPAGAKLTRELRHRIFAYSRAACASGKVMRHALQRSMPKFNLGSVSPGDLALVAAVAGEPQ